MTTKLKNYRINITDDAQPGDALVVGEDDGFVTCHMGTSASCDIGTSCGNIPVLDENGKIPSASMPSVVMNKEVYDQCCCNADAFNYENFYNTPTIPEVFDPVVTFTQGGVTKGSISLNQASPTVISLDAGGVTAGCAIDIYNSKVSVKYDGTTIGKNNCNEICVVDYNTIKQGATCGATAVQANDLATVAMSGKYCDLEGKPEIPSSQIQSDWAQTNINLADYIKNKPTIGNATITLQKNGTNVDCFELNQTTNKCLNLTLNKCDVGLNNVDNTSDADKPISDATQCALNCKQDNITDLNTIRCNACAGKTASETIANYGDIVSHNVCEFATATQGGKADTAVQPGDLCAVATSGKYCDLTGTPVLCDVATTGCYNDLSGTPILAEVATSGKYCDLSGTPELCTVATTGCYNDLTGKPNLCTVATSGKYCDLSGTPLLCAIATSAKYCDLLGAPNLCTVATSGKYCDLSGLPTIPTDNCQLSNSCGYTTCIGTLVANDLTPYAKCNDLANVATSGNYCDLNGKPTIPTNNNQLANGCGYTTCTGTVVATDLEPYAKSCDICTVATSGKYCDLTGTPSLCTVATSGKYCDLSGTPSFCTVATSGKYCDLSGTPTIPTDNCQLSNSCGYTTCTGTVVASDLEPYAKSCTLCNVATSGKYCDLSGKPTIPTDNCQLANSCGYITNAVSNLTNYYLKCETYKKCEVDNLIANFGGFEVVSTLPTTNIKTNVIYLLGPIGTGSDKYEEWIYYNNTWTKIGETTTDLSNYAKCCDIPTDNCQLSNSCGYTTCTGTLVANDLSPYAKSCDVLTKTNTTNYTPSCNYHPATKKYVDDCLNCKVNKGTNTTDSFTYFTITDSCGYGEAGFGPSYIYMNYCDGCGAEVMPGKLSAGTSTNYTEVCDGGVHIIDVANMAHADMYLCKICYIDNLEDICENYEFTGSGCNQIARLKDIPSVDLSNYLAKDNTTAFTPSGDYNPATKKYVDDCLACKANSSSLCTVATSGKYCDLTGKPTIPTDNCQLSNSCGYTTCTGTLVSGDLAPYVKSCDLCNVATSAKYCDLTGTPDLSGYALSCNMVCSLDGADNNHYPTTLAVANALGSAGYGDMLKATYDPCNCSKDAFNYCNMYNKPSLCTVATSGKYCDLTGTPTIPAALNAGTGISIENNKINAQNLYVINEDAIDVTYTGELGVAPYNACYCYTNVCINPNCGVHWVEGATYIFNLDTKVSNSACRNVRLKIGNGDYIPLMGTTAIVNGNSYFTKAAIRPFQYSTKYQECGALHVISDSNTTYSAMSVAEFKANTCTCARSVTSKCLNAILDCYKTDNFCKVATSGKYCDLSGQPTIPTNNNQLTNGCGYTTCTGTVVASDLNAYAKTCTLCTVATSGKYCDLSGAPSLATVATTGCYNDLAGKPTIPTKVSQLTNDCNYINKDVNNLSCYTPTSSLATVATSGAYCDLSGTPTLACVACSGSYEDLSCKPNLGVYQTTANMVCSLTNADDSHYPSAKTVADALSACGAGDMLKATYDPCNKNGNAFDYTNFINTPLLCTVATSGKYCDLTGLPTIPSELTSGCAIGISSNKINVQYDGTTIKKNTGNCLYVDFTGYALSCDVIKCNSTTGSQTVCTTASGCTTAFGVKSNATSSYISLNNCSGWLASIGATSDKKPTWYNGTGHALAYEECIPTDNCQLSNGCGYTTCTGTLVSSDLTPYAKSCTLCTIATSGKYCDLTGTPSLCTVATSGKYCDLTDTPTIPTVNTKTFTLSSASDTTNATAAATFINGGGNAIILYNGQAYVLSSKTSTQMVFKGQTTSTANTSYTNLSQSTLAFTVSGNNVSAISTTATSLGSYLETNRNYGTAFTPTCAGHPATKKYVDDSLSGYVQTSSLCTVATSGKYCDLSEKPTIPTDNCQLANSCGYTTCTGTITSADLATYAKCTDIPTNNNQLTNGCGYTTCTGTLVASDLNPYAKSCTLCTVATSGKYCDLSGIPSLCTVATSGKYCDLTGTPAIPSVGDATITLTQGGNSIGCFTTNSSTSNTIDFEYGICYICCSCASCYSSCCDNRTYIIYE